MITPAQAATQTTPQNQPTSPSPTSALTSDFETFLRMLTAQARHQDPLEPLDSSEYAAQLAQFSMVEQQVQTNDLITRLTSVLGGNDLGQLAGWVGMDVRTTAAFRFDQSPVTLFAQAEPAATDAVLVIRGADGTVLDRQNVPVSQTEFQWAGVDENGNPMPSGLYSATLESYRNGDKLADKPVASFDRVVEAQVGNDSVMLTLASGQSVAVADVDAVRTGA